jgi:hypothetical protein
MTKQLKANVNRSCAGPHSKGGSHVGKCYYSLQI